MSNMNIVLNAVEGIWLPMDEYNKLLKQITELESWQETMRSGSYLIAENERLQSELNKTRLTPFKVYKPAMEHSVLIGDGHDF